MSIKYGNLTLGSLTPQNPRRPGMTLFFVNFHFSIVPIRGRVATVYMGIAFILLGFKNAETLHNQRMEALVAVL